MLPHCWLFTFSFSLIVPFKLCDSARLPVSKPPVCNFSGVPSPDYKTLRSRCEDTSARNMRQEVDCRRVTGPNNKIIYEIQHISPLRNWNISFLAKIRAKYKKTEEQCMKYCRCEQPQ